MNSEGTVTDAIDIEELKTDIKSLRERGDEFTKGLWIDRREDSKSLAWSSVLLAYHNIGKIGEVVDRPKRNMI